MLTSFSVHHIAAQAIRGFYFAPLHKFLHFFLLLLGDMDGWERCNRSFYMLLLSEEDSLFDCGLDSLQTKIMGQQPFDRTVVQNHFQPKPKPFHLPLEGKVSCVSVSKSHAAVVVGSDQTVLTWGRGRDGALGLDEHLVLNFDPPSPLRVTSMNCKVSQVTCGIDFTLFLTSDGQVYSCGSGKMGKLGHGDETDRLLPTLVSYSFKSSHFLIGILQ